MGILPRGGYAEDGDSSAAMRGCEGIVSCAWVVMSEIYFAVAAKFSFGRVCALRAGARSVVGLCAACRGCVQEFRSAIGARESGF